MINAHFLGKEEKYKDDDKVRQKLCHKVARVNQPFKEECKVCSKDNHNSFNLSVDS